VLFRSGMADVHPGQYLNAGTRLTTLQGVANAAHVHFTVAQQVAEELRVGDKVEVSSSNSSPTLSRIVAIDARIDPSTRNAIVRARIETADDVPAPGASVRVRVPVGPPRTAVAIPVNALRKGPGGDHVFVIGPDENGKNRAQLRSVKSGDVVGDKILIHAGLSAGEQVATSGSFKLNDAMLVTIANNPTLLTSRVR
jgi:membrane fusion protein (multidrug efflux system)